MFRPPARETPPAYEINALVAESFLNALEPAPIHLLVVVYHADQIAFGRSDARVECARPPLPTFKDVVETTAEPLQILFDGLPGLVGRVVINDGDANVEAVRHFGGEQTVQCPPEHLVAIVRRNYDIQSHRSAPDAAVLAVAARALCVRPRC